MKKIIALLSVFLLALIAFGQDSTATGGGFTSNPTAILVVSIVLGVYELLARLIPTIKNYSIIGVVIKLLQTVFPNNSATTKKLP